MTLADRLKLAQAIPSMEEQYAGVLAPDKLEDAKFRLSKLEQSIADATPERCCGTALHGMGKRARLLKAQISRSERVSE